MIPEYSILTGLNGPEFVSYVVPNDEVDEFLSTYNDHKVIWQVMPFSGILTVWSMKRPELMV